MARTSQLSLGSENDDVFDLEERKEVAHRERDHPQRLFYSFLVGLEAFFGSQTGLHGRRSPFVSPRGPSKVQTKMGLRFLV